MRDDLIRRCDVLDLLNDLVNDFDDNYELYSELFDSVDEMKPVNAVELPCRIGDTIYVVRDNGIHKAGVTSFRIHTDAEYVHYYDYSYGGFGGFCKSKFSEQGVIWSITREEAEAALRKRKEKRNETKRS